MAQEAIALELGAAAGLRVIAVRAFNHTGPGQRPIYAVPAFAKQILDAMADGRPTFPVGDLEVRRDLTDVRDVAVAYRRLVEVAWEVAPSMASQVVNVAWAGPSRCATWWPTSSSLPERTCGPSPTPRCFARASQRRSGRPEPCP